MTKTKRKSAIGIIALLTVSACVTQGNSGPVAHASKQCLPPNTLTCEKFADETYNCTCQRSDNLRDILDSNRTPDY